MYLHPSADTLVVCVMLLYCMWKMWIEGIKPVTLDLEQVAEQNDFW